MAGLYSIIEGATGHRDALIWPSLGKSREAFTAMLVAANAYYLSLATASAEEARRNTETIEKTIPVMSDLADNDLQRLALQRLNTRAVALRVGLAKLSEQLAPIRQPSSAQSLRKRDFSFHPPLTACTLEPEVNNAQRNNRCPSSGPWQALFGEAAEKSRATRPASKEQSRFTTAERVARAANKACRPASR